MRADAGVTPEQLVSQLKAADLDPKADVVTGEQAAEEQASEVKSSFAFFTTMLLVFAFIALFVGWFIISNTFSILVAQRTKELALLRAIGATRRQVLGSVFLEAAVIGVVSAILGFLGGVALAKTAFVLLDWLGLSLPQTSLVVTPAIAIGAMVAGLWPSRGRRDRPGRQGHARPLPWPPCETSPSTAPAGRGSAPSSVRSRWRSASCPSPPPSVPTPPATPSPGSASASS